MVEELINNVTDRNGMEQFVVNSAHKTNLRDSESVSIYSFEISQPFEDIEQVKTRLRDKGFYGELTITNIDMKAERYVPSDISYELQGGHLVLSGRSLQLGYHELVEFSYRYVMGFFRDLFITM